MSTPWGRYTSCYFFPPYRDPSTRAMHRYIWTEICCRWDPSMRASHRSSNGSMTIVDPSIRWIDVIESIYDRCIDRHLYIVHRSIVSIDIDHISIHRSCIWSTRRIHCVFRWSMYRMSMDWSMTMDRREGYIAYFVIDPSQCILLDDDGSTIDPITIDGSIVTRSTMTIDPSIVIGSITIEYFILVNGSSRSVSFSMTIDRRSIRWRSIDPFDLYPVTIDGSIVTRSGHDRWLDSVMIDGSIVTRSIDEYEVLSLYILVEYLILYGSVEY